MSNDSDQPAGQQGITDATSQFNVRAFQITQALGAARTMIPVKVIAIHGGGLGPAGTVDVMPLVKQMDGLSKTQSHATIYGLPYTRLQGGLNAIINDPIVGDIGTVVVADRDISSVKANSGEANPGSFRRFSLSDGVYHGAILIKGTPNQYVMFTATGIKIADKNGNIIEMKSGCINVTTAEFRVNGKVIAGYGTGDQVGLQSHTHSDPQGGTVPAADPGT
jgi:hypothetical protein